MASSIFDELEVMPLFRGGLMDSLKEYYGDEYDRESVKATAEHLYGLLLQKESK